MAYKALDEVLSNFQDRIIGVKSIDSRNAVFEPVPARCHTSIKKGLATLGIKQLYSHQARMFSEVDKGKNVIITTGTSSGKSLAFYLPVLQRIIEDSRVRALFIYPTKALAHDQKANLEKILKAIKCTPEITVGVYDGDTPPSERKKIREHANIILTNPDMLNVSFLPNHNRHGFQLIFRNLDFVVLDELHVYRGAFGTHVANLMRRILRICDYHGVSPQFLCSSATIANPLELAGNICCRPFILIDNDGSFNSGKKLVFWQCPLSRDTINEVVDLIPDLVVNDISSITFCQSRRDVEVTSREIRDILAQQHGSGNIQNRVSAYRSGLTPNERRSIELNLRTGKLRGVISTNALELGIDIGSLDVVVMAGFPGTKASFWQQAGRAGRRSGNASILIILSNRPIEHYIAQDLNWLTESNVENAIVDVSNIFIQLAHIRAAAYELPLSRTDIKYFHDLGVIVPKLVETGELTQDSEQFLWAHKNNTNPAMEISLRNMNNESIDVVDSQSEKTITSTDLITAKYELFPGAIYLHDGIQYKVLALNFEEKQAILTGVNSNHYTVPFVNTAVRILDTVNHKSMFRCQAAWGNVKVTSLINAYKKIAYFTHENLGFEELDTDLIVDLDTEGTWIVLPDNLQTLPTRLGSGDESPVSRDSKYDIDGFVFALVNAASIRTMASYGDIGGTIFGVGDPLRIALLIYDKYQGGLGFAQKIYEVMEDVILDAIKIVESCPCKHGCPSCVGHMQIDKIIVLWALRNLKVESPMPESLELMPKVPVLSTKPVIRNKYELKWIEEHWSEFAESFKLSYPDTYHFLLLVQGVTILKSTIRLAVWKSRIFFLPNHKDYLLAVKENVRNSIHEQVEVVIELEDDPGHQTKQAKLDRYFNKSSDIQHKGSNTLDEDTKSTDTNEVFDNSQQSKNNREALDQFEELDSNIVDLILGCLEIDDYEQVMQLPNKVLLTILTDRPGSKAIGNIRSCDNYQKMLKSIVSNHRSTNVQCAALSLVEDEAFIVETAFDNLYASIRQTAVDMIADPQLLLKIAINDRSSKIRASVVARISEPALLEQIVIGSSEQDTMKQALKNIDDIVILTRLATESRFAALRNMALARAKRLSNKIEKAEKSAEKEGKQQKPPKLLSPYEEWVMGIDTVKPINHRCKKPPKQISALENRVKVTDAAKPINQRRKTEKRKTPWEELREKYQEELLEVKIERPQINLDVFSKFTSLNKLLMSIIVEENSWVQEQDLFIEEEYSWEQERDLYTLVTLKKNKFELYGKKFYPNLMIETESVFKDIVLSKRSQKSKLAAIRGIDDQKFLKYLLFAGADKDFRLALVQNITDLYLLEQLTKLDRSKVVREQAYHRLLDLKWAAMISDKIDSSLAAFLNKSSLVVVDTETTGLTPVDRICQLAFVKLDSSGIETFSDYCNPHVPVNPFAYMVHGLSDSFLKKQKDIKKTPTYNKLKELLADNCVFVFHNAPFDLRFLSYDGVNIDNPVVDTLKIIRQMKCFPDNKLSTALTFLKRVFNDLEVKQHDALGDALTTLHLLKWLCNAYPCHVGRIISEGGNCSAYTDPVPHTPTRTSPKSNRKPTRKVINESKAKSISNVSFDEEEDDFYDF